MDRRDFLTAGAGALAVAASAGRTTRAQQARQPDPAKLERIAIMTLDFGALLKLPDQPASPTRTLEVFDIPEMLADVYGVHNVEFQHTHIASTERSYLQDLRARLEAHVERRPGGVLTAGRERHALGVRHPGGLVKALADRLPTLDDHGADERVRTRPTMGLGSQLDSAHEKFVVSLGGGEGIH